MYNTFDECAYVCMYVINNSKLFLINVYFDKFISSVGKGW